MLTLFLTGEFTLADGMRRPRCGVLAARAIPRRIMLTPLTFAPITMALPTGRILKEALPLLARIGIVPEAADTIRWLRPVQFRRFRKCAITKGRCNAPLALSR